MVLAVAESDRERKQMTKRQVLEENIMVVWRPFENMRESKVELNRDYERRESQRSDFSPLMDANRDTGTVADRGQS
jgi:hypothetical protein